MLGTKVKDLNTPPPRKTHKTASKKRRKKSEEAPLFRNSFLTVGLDYIMTYISRQIIAHALTDSCTITRKLRLAPAEEFEMF